MYIQTKITKKAYFAVRNGNCEKKNWSSELFCCDRNFGEKNKFLYIHMYRCTQ